MKGEQYVGEDTLDEELQALVGHELPSKYLKAALGARAMGARRPSTPT